VLVDFYENAKGIAPGQSAVFYDGDDVIGGGIIQNSISTL
jgi:tRNA-specific 2-thiouridylase